MKHNKLFITLALLIGFSSATNRAEQAPSNWTSWTLKAAATVGLVAIATKLYFDISTYFANKLGNALAESLPNLSAIRPTDPLIIELINANYNQDKIKELREKFKHDRNKLHVLNETLTSIYSIKIKEALKLVPEDQRNKWLDNLGRIFTVDIPAYKKNQEGPAIISTTDGSELGTKGTKYQALQDIIDRNLAFSNPFYQDPQSPNGPDVVEFAQSLGTIINTIPKSTIINDVTYIGLEK